MVHTSSLFWLKIGQKDLFLSEFFSFYRMDLQSGNSFGAWQKCAHFYIKDIKAKIQDSVTHLEFKDPLHNVKVKIVCTWWDCK